MKNEHSHNSTTQTDTGETTATAELENFLNSVTRRDQFREPEFKPDSDQPLDYETAAVEHAIPIFEALHRLAGNQEKTLRNPERTMPLASDGAMLAECLAQFGTLCYTLHHLAELATTNLDTDYHPHQAICANSELLRELACLAFQIEPCFSEPEELENAAGPLMPNSLPHIVPITGTDFHP